MLKEIITTLLLTSTVGTPTIKNYQPRKANTERCFGVYNYKDEYTSQDWLDIIDTFNDNYGGTEINDLVVVLEETYSSNYQNLCPIYINENNYYLTSIQFNGDLDYYTLRVRFNYYEDNESHTTHYTEDTITPGSNPTDFNYESTMFYARTSLYLADEYKDIFTFVFTHEDNAYVTSYNGYYTFMPNLTTVDYRMAIYGNVTLGQRMNYTLYGKQTTSGSNSTNKLFYNYYDAQNDTYKDGSVQLPLNSQSLYSNRWYISNSKMPLATYNKLTSYGTFAYIPETIEDYSFEDLFFSLADTPIYFVYSMFNWQLFGANLFIAFVGLISFALILILFRKFL